MPKRLLTILAIMVLFGVVTVNAATIAGTPILIEIKDEYGAVYAIAGIVDIVRQPFFLSYYNDTYANTTTGIQWWIGNNSLRVCSVNNSIVFLVDFVGDVIGVGRDNKYYLFGRNVIVLEANNGKFSVWNWLGLKGCANISIEGEYPYDVFIKKIYGSNVVEDPDKVVMTLMNTSGSIGATVSKLLEGEVNASTTILDPATFAILVYLLAHVPPEEAVNYTELTDVERSVIDAVYGYNTLKDRAEPPEYGYYALTYALLGVKDLALRYGLAGLFVDEARYPAALAIGLATPDYAKTIAAYYIQHDPGVALLLLAPQLRLTNNHGGGGGESVSGRSTARFIPDQLTDIVAYVFVSIAAALVVISLFIRYEYRRRVVVAGFIVLTFLAVTAFTPVSSAETDGYGELTIRVDVYFPDVVTVRSAYTPINYTINVYGFTSSPVKIVFIVPHVANFTLVEAIPSGVSFYRYLEGGETPGYVLVLPGHTRVNATITAVAPGTSMFFRNSLNGLLVLRGYLDGETRLREVYVYHLPRGYFYEYYLQYLGNLVEADASSDTLTIVYERYGRTMMLTPPPSIIYYNVYVTSAATAVFATLAVLVYYYMRRKATGSNVPAKIGEVVGGIKWFFSLLPSWKTIFTLALVVLGAWYVVTVSTLSPENAPVVATVPYDQETAMKYADKFVTFLSSVNVHRIGDFPFANHIIVYSPPRNTITTPFKPSSVLVPNIYFFLQHGGYIYIPENPPRGTFAEYVAHNMLSDKIVTYRDEALIYGEPDYTLLSIVGFFWTLGLVLTFLSISRALFERKNVAVKIGLSILVSALITIAGQTSAWIPFAAHFRYSVLNYTPFWFAGRALFRLIGLFLATIFIVFVIDDIVERHGDDAYSSASGVDPRIGLVILFGFFALMFSPTTIGTDLTNAMSSLIGGEVTNIKTGITGVIDDAYTSFVVNVYRALGFPSMGTQLFLSRGGASFMIFLMLLFFITKGYIRSWIIRYVVAYIFPLVFARSAMRLFELGWQSLVPTLSVSVIVGLVVAGFVAIIDRLILLYYSRGGGS